VPEVTAPAGETLTNADERLLVEYAVTARNAYIDSVNKVIVYYKNTRQDFKGKVIENMRDRLDPINLYPYFPEAMLPPRDLKPVDVIPEAEAMYTKAEKLFWDGKGLLHIFITTSYEKERQAAVLFQKLIHDYPRSIRIAMSAYYLAEINKEYFRQNTLAVFWYERAWTWDPNLPEPARFQAATVYDIHLHNYTKAVECYRLSLKYDPTRPGNRWLCEKRVKELTGLQ
jgi:tetratricopeptide (TPR) repeat protein